MRALLFVLLLCVAPVFAQEQAGDDPNVTVPFLSPQP